MKVFKVTTSWTGFSEITVEAETQEEAIDLVQMGEYDCNNEVSTGNGLSMAIKTKKLLLLKKLKENKNEY
jgi:hypothetical protein